jgi:integrase
MEVVPIKDLKKITAIKKILSTSNKRDELLFVMGINSALRISDLLSLTVGDVVNLKGKIVDDIELKEKKTGKIKRFPLNKSIKETLSDYLENITCDDRTQPLFLSRKGNKAITRHQARRILLDVGKSVGLKNIGTHSLRKTFSYHVFQKTGGNLALVQKILNHSNSGMTLRYIGIDKQEMDSTYLDLNL